MYLHRLLNQARQGSYVGRSVESRHLDALARGRKVNALAAALGDTEASLTGNALGRDAGDAGAAGHVSRLLQG